MILQRVRFISGERCDLPDVDNLQAFGNADATAFMENVTITTSLIVKGFDITSPGSYISTAPTSVPFNVDGAVLFHPSSTGGAGAFYVGASGADAQSPSLIANTTNYIEVDQATSTGAPDIRAIWDEAGGADGTGAEFSQTIDTVTYLDVVITSNTVGFTAGKVPIAKIVLDSNGFITSITDCRPLFFRLGSGGNAPDVNYVYPWPVPRTDHGITMTAPGDDNCFTGSDKQIDSMKSWMDAVMTRIAEIQGSSNWFTAGALSASVNNVYFDSVGSIVTSKLGTGKFTFSGAFNLAWDDDIKVQSIDGPYFFAIKASNQTLTLNDILYVTQIRNQALATALAWTNGQTYVNGVATAFTGLESDATNASGYGDWIRKTTDGTEKLVRIVNFYDAAGGAGGGGAITTAALAVSVEVASAYTGTTASVLPLYSKGAYVVTKAQVSTVAYNANNWWLAYRGANSKAYIRVGDEMPAGSARTIGGSVPDAVLAYVGVADEITSTPTYSSSVSGSVQAPNWQTTSTENLTLRASKLTSLAASASQDKNLILIRKQPTSLSDNFKWDGTTLTWEELYLGTIGDDELRNKITNSNNTLADQDCLYVTIHRDAGVNAALTMTKAAISSLDPLTLNDQVFVIARRIGNLVYARDGQLVYAKPFITIGDGVASQGDFVGTTDAIFTTAIAALPSGGTIYVNRGTYTFGSKLTISQNNITLQGVGRELSIITGSISADSVVELAAGVTGVTIRDLTIKQTQGPSHNYALNMLGTECLVENCRLEHTYAGGAADSAPYQTVRILNTTANRLLNNRILATATINTVKEQRAAIGIYAISTSASTATTANNIISGNTIELTPNGVAAPTAENGAITIQSGTTSTGFAIVRDNTITNNTFLATSTAASSFYGAFFIIRSKISTGHSGITNNVISNNDFGNANLGFGVGPIIIYNTAALGGGGDNISVNIIANNVTGQGGSSAVFEYAGITPVGNTVNTYPLLGGKYVSSTTPAFTSEQITDTHFNA